jgi:ParB family chromosome partitioning protein
MANTRNVLERIKQNVEESMGVRQHDSRPQLSPVPNAKDVGRRALRTFGMLSISQLIPDPEQPRTEFSEEEIEQLALSIREKGQLHPIRVRWSEEHKKWIIISGERRFQASKRAGLETVECHFHDGELSHSEILEQQLIENLLRSDLRPMEEARAFDRLLKLNGWTGKELSEALRVSQGKIARSLALLRLPEDIQERVESGSISARAAYEASKLDSPEQQRKAIEQSELDGTSVTAATVQRQVRQRQGKKAAAPHGTKQTYAVDGGWKITVSASHKGNYAEIEQALEQALAEVRLRIENNVQLF